MPSDVLTFSSSEVSIRYREPYLTDAINAKEAGPLPHGVYKGFKVGTSGVALSVDIATDSDEHLAVCRTSTGRALTIRKAAGSYTLDLTAYAASTVYLAIYASYGIGAATGAYIRAYTAAEYAALLAADKAALVVLGKVVVPAAGVIAATSITPDDRTYAWDNEPSGRVAWSEVLANPSFRTGAPAPAYSATTSFKRFCPGWEFTTADTTSCAILPAPSVSVSGRFGSGTAAVARAVADGTFVFAGSLTQHIGLAVIGGSFLRVRGYKRVLTAPVGGAPTATVLVVMRDAAGAGVPSLSLSLSLAGVDADYVKFEQTFRLPTNAALVEYVQISIAGYNYAASPANLIAFDDVQVFAEVKNTDLRHVGAERAGGTALVRSVTFMRSGGESHAGFNPTAALESSALVIARNDGSTTAEPLPLDYRGRVVLGTDSLHSGEQYKPRIYTKTHATTLTLVSESGVDNFDGVATGIHSRHYATSEGGIAFTSNARWDAALNKWIKDVDNVYAQYLQFDVTGVPQIQSFRIANTSGNGAGGFSNADWTDNVLRVPAAFQIGAQLTGATGRATPRLEIATTDASTFTLVERIIDATNNVVVRRYVDGSTQRRITTTNAYYDGANWKRDIAVATPTMVTYDPTLNKVLTNTAAAGVADSVIAWGVSTLLLNSGVRPTGLAAGDTPETDVVYATSPAKAWASVSTNTSANLALDDEFNIASVAASNAVTSVATVTFRRPMNSGDYAVHVSVINVTIASHTVTITSRLPGSFTFSVLTGGSGVNLTTTSDYKFAITVHGRHS